MKIMTSIKWREEMQEISEFLLNHNTLAVLIAAVIFVITIILVIRRLIGFVITLVLLLFAIASGLIIANQDVFRDILKSVAADKRSDSEVIKDQASKVYEEAKEEVNKYIEQVKDAYQDYKNKQEAPKEPITPPPSQS